MWVWRDDQRRGEGAGFAGGRGCAKGCGLPRFAGKAKEPHSPLDLPECTHPVDTLILAHRARHIRLLSSRTVSYQAFLQL